MTILDRVIAVVSPRAAANRVANRTRLRYAEQLEKRSYDGASRTKRNRDWNPARGNANSILGPAADILRARAYDLTRNNPHAALIPTRHADNMVGAGIQPKFKTGNANADEILKKAWKKFSKAKNFDPAGLISFEAATYKAVWNMVAGGEYYARRRNRRLTDGYPVPFQVQTFEADMVDWSKVSTAASRPKNVVIQGIEFDALGRRYGYWMFRESPNGSRSVFLQANESSLVPAEEMVHLYEPRRDQVHGETWLAPVMTDLRDLQDYKIAELVRKKTEACMVGVIQPPDDAEDDEGPKIGLPDQPRYDPDTGELLEDELGWQMTDIDGDFVERFEPGMFYQTKPGTTVSWNTPATSAGYDTYMRTQLRDIAAGARITYEAMTGDLSEVSFASGRMGRLDYQRFVEAIQWNYLIPMWCDPIAGWFVESMKATGQIAVELDVDVEWTPPAFQSITPIDDANTDLTEVRSGFASWDSKIRARGMDPDETAAEIVARNKFFDDNGVVLDSDPRLLSKNGQKHQTASAGGAEGETDAPGEQDREAVGRDGRRPSGRSRKRRRQAGSPAG